MRGDLCALPLVISMRRLPLTDSILIWFGFGVFLVLGVNLVAAVDVVED